MNTPDQYRNAASGITLFAALCVGHLVGSTRKETSDAIHIVIEDRTLPTRVHTVPLRSEDSLTNTQHTVELASFKAIDFTPSTILPKADYSPKVSKEAAQSVPNVIQIEVTPHKEFMEFSTTVPTKIIAFARTKFYEVITECAKSMNIHTITVTEHRLADGTTELKGVVTQADQTADKD